MADPRIEIAGLTTKQARRVADIGDALTEGGLEVVAFLDPRHYDFDPPAQCEGCECVLEGGHCYCCFPVWGYGDRFSDARHGPGFRPRFLA